MSDGGEDTVLERDEGDGIRILTLNRPDRLNCWHAPMRRRLRDVIEAAAVDPGLRALIITGAGRAFSAGEDVSGMAGLADLGTRGFRAVAHEFHDIFDLIEAIEVPVIAAINGVAAGGGFELALSCDFRVMSEEARLVMPEGKVGLIPGSGGCSRLVRHVGLSRAKEMVMLGRPADAATAKAYGLVVEVAPPDKTVDAALDIARELSRFAPLALGMAKLVLNTCTDVDAETGRRLERLGQSVLKTTEDHREAASAFLEKRPPTFSGR